MMPGHPRPQAECLHHLQRLLPSLSNSCPSVADSLIDRIIATCSFLHQKMDSPPSPLDQSKVLSLAKMFSSMSSGHAKLTEVMENVLFYVKKHASLFLTNAEDTFLESLLLSLLSVSAMRRHVVDTVIGIFKQMPAAFSCQTRAVALQKMTVFMSTNLLSKDFLLHPSSHVVAEVLISHIRWVLCLGCNLCRPK